MDEITYILLMARYDGGVLWSENMVLLDDEIDLPPELEDRAARWGHFFRKVEDEGVNEEDDVDVDMDNPLYVSMLHQFSTQGRDLAFELKRHFGPDVTIMYHDLEAFHKAIIDEANLILDLPPPYGGCREYRYEITNDMVCGSETVRSFFEEQRSAAKEQD